LLDPDVAALQANPAIAALRATPENRNVFPAKEQAGAIAFTSPLSFPFGGGSTSADAPEGSG
jgi:iron complex transport system substrate-binding protein